MTEQEKREKIIEEFERFMQEYDRDIGFTSYDSEVMKGVLALLKAHETIVSIRPIRCSAHAQVADDVWYECSGCGAFLGVNRYSKQVCSKCGKAVRWE